MNISFVKPPLIFANQVDRLEAKGLIISDKAEVEAFLARVNYYRLRGYHVPLYDQPNDCFIDGITFDHLIGIYNFDADLRLLMLQQIIAIEVSMRAHVAYTLAHQYGGLGYTDACNFNNEEYHKAFEITYKKEVDRSKDTHIKHFIKNYNGDIFILAVQEREKSRRMLCTSGLRLVPVMQKL